MAKGQYNITQVYGLPFKRKEVLQIMAGSKTDHYIKIGSLPPLWDVINCPKAGDQILVFEDHYISIDSPTKIVYAADNKMLDQYLSDWTKVKAKKMLSSCSRITLTIQKVVMTRKPKGKDFYWKIYFKTFLREMVRYN